MDFRGLQGGGGTRNELRIAGLLESMQGIRTRNQPIEAPRRDSPAKSPSRVSAPRLHRHTPRKPPDVVPASLRAQPGTPRRVYTTPGLASRLRRGFSGWSPRARAMADLISWIRLSVREGWVGGSWVVDAARAGLLQGGMDPGAGALCSEWGAIVRGDRQGGYHVSSRGSPNRVRSRNEDSPKGVVEAGPVSPVPI